MFWSAGRTVSASAEQRPCHDNEPHNDAISEPFVRDLGVSGRTADTVADTLPDRTCDHSASRCIYSAVTSSFADLQIPQTLIDRACAGELRAFEQIYRRFERPMYTLALRMLGEADAARDVLHDAMLKAFQRIGQYRQIVANRPPANRFLFADQE